MPKMALAQDFSGSAACTVQVGCGKVAIVLSDSVFQSSESLVVRPSLRMSNNGLRVELLSVQLTRRLST